MWRFAFLSLACLFAQDTFICAPKDLGNTKLPNKTRHAYFCSAPGWVLFFKHSKNLPMQEQELPEWAQRVQQEREALAKLIARGQAFISTPGAIEQVGPIQFQLIDAQLDAMRAYLKILDARLLLA
jgi:hypothetical protein